MHSSHAWLYCQQHLLPTFSPLRCVQRHPAQQRRCLALSPTEVIAKVRLLLACIEPAEGIPLAAGPQHGGQPLVYTCYVNIVLDYFQLSGFNTIGFAGHK